MHFGPILTVLEPFIGRFFETFTIIKLGVKLKTHPEFLVCWRGSPTVKNM